LNQILIFKMYVVGFAVSFLIQSIGQDKFGRESAWGINRGWQTEIAIWNVFAIMVLTTLIFSDVGSDIVIFSLFVMSMGFGVNHFLAALRGGKIKSNIVGATANSVGVVIILLWYIFSRH